MPVDYSKTKIYMLFCDDNIIPDIYIGYTADIITKRMAVHRRCTHNSANNSYNRRMYRFIRDNGGWSNWSYRIIDEPNCQTKTEARKIEQEWILYYNPSLNTNKK
jgi:hypothetical protein